MECAIATSRLERSLAEVKLGAGIARCWSIVAGDDSTAGIALKQPSVTGSFLAMKFKRIRIHGMFEVRHLFNYTPSYVRLAFSRI